jgi:hypothetical protein
MRSEASPKLGLGGRGRLRSDVFSVGAINQRWGNQSALGQSATKYASDSSPIQGWVGLIAKPKSRADCEA